MDLLEQPAQTESSPQTRRRWMAEADQVTVMIQSLFTASNGLEVEVVLLDATSHNIANLNTTAFKRSEVSFQDLFNKTIRAAGTEGAAGNQIPTGTQVGTGAQVAAVARNHQQGQIQFTGLEFDVAIEGEGFFRIELPDGRAAYTRDGTFSPDADGTLVTADGFIVQPQLTIPPGLLSVNIAPMGEVTGIPASAPTTTVDIGEIELTRFLNPVGLSAVRDNIYLESAASGGPDTGAPGSDGRGRLQQNAIERSNAELATELTKLIIGQRAFEANSRVIITSAEMLQTANDVVR